MLLWCGVVRCGLVRYVQRGLGTLAASCWEENSAARIARSPAVHTAARTAPFTRARTASATVEVTVSKGDATAGSSESEPPAAASVEAAAAAATASSAATASATSCQHQHTMKKINEYDNTQNASHHHGFHKPFRFAVLVSTFSVVKWLTISSNGPSESNAICSVRSVAAPPPITLAAAAKYA